jgi:hypothetical protein
MIKYIKEYGWCFWLGAAIPIFTKIGALDWQFYAIVIPTVFLVVLNLKNQNHKQQNKSNIR